MNALAQPVSADDTQQPRQQQYKSDLQQHSGSSAHAALAQSRLRRRAMKDRSEMEEMRMAKRRLTASHADSSWSQYDPLEDGGPTIRLPAAESACTLFEDVQYTRRDINAINRGVE